MNVLVQPVTYRVLCSADVAAERARFVQLCYGLAEALGVPFGASTDTRSDSAVVYFEALFADGTGVVLMGDLALGGALLCCRWWAETRVALDGVPARPGLPAQPGRVQECESVVWSAYKPDPTTPPVMLPAPQPTPTPAPAPPPSRGPGPTPPATPNP